MRIDTIYISANSFLYDLRVATSLLSDSTTALYPAESIDCVQSILASMIRRIEDGSEVFLVTEARELPPEEGLGEAPLQRDSDGELR